ncbi:MAG: hypothetical protein PHC88_05385 [Terrimicrobiaceae bacterium]|nr:hypothetical protein [Terrimicrobiaceae bacterium]
MTRAVKKRNVSKKQIAWLLSTMDRTDRQRAAAAGLRVRRYIDCWEFLKAHGDWIMVADLVSLLHVNAKLVRRTLYHLEASGLVQLKCKGIGSAMEARVRFR